MITPDRVLNTARSQIGESEHPLGSNRTKYGSWFGMDGQPWCGMFVSWVFDQAGLGLDITSPKGFAYCPAAVNWFKSQAQWAAPFDANPGDIVFYEFNEDTLADHVGIVESVDRINRTVTAIEGNTNSFGSPNGDQVMQKVRPFSLIAGIGVVRYPNQTLLNTPAPAEEDMPSNDDIVSEYRWASGPLVRLTRDGGVRCYGVPFVGSIHDIPVAGKKNWTDGAGVISPVDPTDHRRGYTVYDVDANMVASFTPEWYAGVKH